MKQTLSLTRKELDSYFSSLMALIFVGVFLAVTLFTFFWVDTFWARGLADVRPLFRWMPLLMIFLVAALTMRQWSEEQQTGTLEILLTMPVRLAQLVIGKFLAVLVLVIVALLLTIFLPITVATLGDLDFGPVVGGYLAAILMASAYIAIGLCVSSLTDNQIVSLIVTVLVCGLFHLVGTSAITDLVDSSMAEILRNISTSGRFVSIERGVIDLRDLLYYVSLTVIFLVLNILLLDSKRWSRGAQMASYRLNGRLTAALVVFNMVGLNVLVSPVNSVRYDLTADQQYSLSDVTKDLLDNLQEPLLIRGYFSEKNHPLLEPLIPQVKDLLEEYEVAAGGDLDVEFIDPIDDPDLEAEANQIYGISPVPLQVSDRSGRSVLNVYFDILIRYGDQSEVLNFQDLITIEEYGGDDIEVRLRNLEYDLTSSIKHVVFGFQSIDNVLASLDEPASLTLFYTPDTLPDALADVPDTIQKVAEDIQAQADGAFNFTMIDVNAADSPVTPDSLYNLYQIQPIATSFFSTDSYYLHMVLQVGNRGQVLYPSGDLSESGIRTSIESGLKRTSPGFLQVVGIWTPPSVTQDPLYGQMETLQQYNVIAQMLQENHEVRAVDLSSGQVAADIDVLLIIAPMNMTDLERYAIDQYLMRGGSVFVAAGNYKLTQDPYSGGLALEPVQDGLREMLASYGITVEESVVLDPQNEPFPVQVQRNAGGYIVTEIQAMNYPHFVDVRTNGMDRDNSIVSTLSAITMNWVSPISLDDDLNKDRDVSRLLKSTSNSWATTSLNIQPYEDLYPDYGFPVDGVQQPYTLAVAVTGSFESFFKDKDLPFEANIPAEGEGETGEEAEQEVNPLAAVGMLEQSPGTARLVVVGSAEFLNDNVLQISSSFSGDRYLNSLQFVQNSVDWFVEDTELATIRSSGASARVLEPLTENEESRWEIINYALALASLGGLAMIWRMRKRAERPMELVLPGEFAGETDQPSEPPAEEEE